MKKEIAQLWCRALRSGEFRQTTLRLENDGAYCVNGVLSALALCEGICTYGNRGLGSFDGRKTSLSFNIQEWSGIKTQNAALIYKGKKTSLADLNDLGYTFSELAKIIQENYEQI